MDLMKKKTEIILSFFDWEELHFYMCKQKVLKKYAELWDGIRNEIEIINGGKKIEYAKVFMKIEFNIDDDLPLNNPLKLHMLTILVRSVFEEDGKFYPQVYLDEFLWIIKNDTTSQNWNSWRKNWF